MKIIAFSILLAAFWGLTAGPATAQRKTIILVRHAEKDLVVKNDPDLTDEGRKRAENLFEVIKKYGPDEIFSSKYRRTRFTALPTALKADKNYRLQIQQYEPSELGDFTKKLLSASGKCLVVVGHSNTTPALANLLIGEEKFKELPEADYGKIWIIKIRGKKATVEVVEY